jgi:hypothetical protein
MLYLVVPLVVLIAVIWGLVAFPSLRVVAVVLVGLGFVLYFVANERASREQKQQEVQKKNRRPRKKKTELRLGPSKRCTARPNRNDGQSCQLLRLSSVGHR